MTIPTTPVGDGSDKHIETHAIPYFFQRREHLERADQRAASGELWDLIIVGGGATGVGMAVDAASRGYTVLLLEQSDFGKGTSSRSTKLVHGGVRYLKQGNLSLVRDALHERSLLLNNAPHVVRDLPFIIPCPNQWQALFYGSGLKLYDLLAGTENLAASHRLGRTDVLARIATLRDHQCAAGILYHDGQFDDARLLVNLAQTASAHGACMINYARVTDLVKTASGQVSGVRWSDGESGREWISQARIVINATGPFCDAVRRMDDPSTKPMVAASQGIHLVLPKRFLPGSTAMMVPKTSDGRVVFLIPWHDRVVLGTTDTAITSVPLEPSALPDEIEFLLATAALYLTEAPQRGDILSIFTGIRPLVVAQPGVRTAKLSRDHTISLSPQGLLTITGGKWTTYRKMAEDGIDQAAQIAGLPHRQCRTASLRIAGAPLTATESVLSGSSTLASQTSSEFDVYGTQQADLDALHSDPSKAEMLDSRLTVTAGQVIWGVRAEMARTVEDILARRTRGPPLDGAAAMAIAPRVAQIMAKEMYRDQDWESHQVAAFQQTAQHFLP